MTLKRILEIAVALMALIILAPVMLVVLFLIWRQDFKNPLYVSKRVGRNQKIFGMLKFRTMIYDAEKSGVFSTSDGDKRITALGHFLRRTKLDETPQLINVVFGQMSFVGPRANVISEVEFYSEEEKRLLSVRPGITDFSSIVFADEGSILAGSQNPDGDYRRLIWPGKSILGLFYVDNGGLLMDIKLILLTIYALVRRDAALQHLSSMLEGKGCAPELCLLVRRQRKLSDEPFIQMAG
jgi:lipopolysaccharide/colanic/teichoic acid biosynthesis glycosyltransferase